MFYWDRASQRSKSIQMYLTRNSYKISLMWSMRNQRFLFPCNNCVNHRIFVFVNKINYPNTRVNYKNMTQTDHYCSSLSTCNSYSVIANICEDGVSSVGEIGLFVKLCPAALIYYNENYVLCCSYKMYKFLS